MINILLTSIQHCDICFSVSTIGKPSSSYPSRPMPYNNNLTRHFSSHLLFHIILYELNVFEKKRLFRVFTMPFLPETVFLARFRAQLGRRRDKVDSCKDLVK